MAKLPIVYDNVVSFPCNNVGMGSLMQPVSAEAVLASERPDLAYDLLYTRDRENYALQRYEAKYSAISNIAQASSYGLVRAIETRGDNREVEIKAAIHEPGFLGLGRREVFSFTWSVKYRR